MKQKKPFRQRKLSKKLKDRAMKAAQHLPNHMQDVAFSLAANRTRPRFGRMGAASGVRTVDEATEAEIRRRYEGKQP